MSTISSVIKAHRALEEANRLLPRNVANAAIRIQRKLGIPWVEALEVVEVVLEHEPRAKLNKSKKKCTLKAKRATGGNVRPKTLAEVEARSETATGDKHHRYIAAAALLRNKGAWIRGEELEKLGVRLNAIKNTSHLSSYLPAGMVVRSARGKGYIAQTLQEALS